MVNLTWISSRLRGLPDTIDVAGYLQRALRDADALSSGGISGFVHAVRTPQDFQAPLLTATAGVVRWVTGAGDLRLTAYLQLFYLVLGWATYRLSRQVLPPWWAALASAVTLSVPSVIQNSRNFDFALPAAALVAQTLSAQLRARDFCSWRSSLWWGVCLGLTTLTRTLMLAFVGILIGVAVVHLLANRPSKAALGRMAAGLLVAFLVAATWYTATWNAVVHYLFNYGYGSQSVGYGEARTWHTLGFWTARFWALVDTDFYVPLAAILVLGAIAGLLVALGRLGRRTEAGAPFHVDWARWRAALGSDVVSVALAGAAIYLLLSSTRNVGSFFELPLVGLLVVLACVAARCLPHPGRIAFVALSGLASLLSVASQAGWIYGGSERVDAVDLLGHSSVAFDNRGVLVEYASEVLGGCPGIYQCVVSQLPLADRDGAQSAAVTAYLRSWNAPVVDATRELYQYSASRGRLPVVFFTVQDPFFNTNTIALQAQQTTGEGLPIGLLEPPGGPTPSYRDQLESPQLGEPNFVIEGPPSRVPASAAFSPQNRPSQVVTALRSDGFRMVDSVRLPDGRKMALWWKLRGPVPPGH